MARQIKPGVRVRVGGGSGLESGVVGVVVPNSAVPKGGRGVPRIHGHFAPMGANEVAISEEGTGRILTMFKNRLEVLPPRPKTFHTGTGFGVGEAPWEDARGSSAFGKGGRFQPRGHGDVRSTGRTANEAMLRQYVVEIDHGRGRDAEVVGSVKLRQGAGPEDVTNAIRYRGIFKNVARVVWHRTSRGAATFFDHDGDIIGYLFQERPD